MFFKGGLSRARAAVPLIERVSLSAGSMAIGAPFDLCGNVFLQVR